ncbi:MAG: AAA family ATPase [Candidatus Jordarchaeales archaeon]
MVIIEELELENFVSHKKTKMKFDLGVTLIVGPNGAGKTSILDGVSFALFKLHSRGKDENVVNRKAKHARVSLKFSIQGRGRYAAEWNIERKKEGCDIKGVIYEITESGKRPITREAGSRTLLPEIARILDVEKETFENSVYVRQGEIERLVTEKPAERKKLVSKLLGIDDFEQAWLMMREIVGEYEKRLEGLRGELKEKERVMEELERLRVELANVEDKISEVEVLARKLEEEAVRAEEKLKVIEEKKRRFEELNVKRVEIKAKLEGKKEKVKATEESLRKLESLKREVEKRKEGYERYVALKNEAERLGEERRQYEGAREAVRIQEKNVKEFLKEEKELEGKINKMMTDYSRLLGVEVNMENVSAISENEKRRVEREIEDLTNRIRELEGRMGELEGRIEDSKDKVKRLSEAKAKCPLCGRELTEEHRERLIKELLEEEAKLKEEKERVGKEMKEAERKLKEENKRKTGIEQIDVEKIKSLREELEDKRKRRRRMEEELEESRSKLEKLVELEKQIEDARKEADRLEADYEAYRQAESQLRGLGSEEILVEAYNIAMKEAEEAEKELLVVEKEMDELGYDEREYEAVKGEAERVKARLEEERRELARLEGEKKRLGEELKNREERARKLEEVEGEVKRLESFIMLLEKVRDAYGKDGIQKLIRARAKPKIESYTKEYLNKFNLEYSDVKLDEDYELTVVGPSGSQSVDTISGGERVALAIALRMAIAKVIAGDKISMMIMDEPTVFLDEERRRELIEILKKGFREEARVIPQLIVVSHDRELEDAADTVYMVTKEGGWSKVEQLEAI